MQVAASDYVPYQLGTVLLETLKAADVKIIEFEKEYNFGGGARSKFVEFRLIDRASFYAFGALQSMIVFGNSASRMFCLVLLASCCAAGVAVTTRGPSSLRHHRDDTSHRCCELGAEGKHLDTMDVLNHTVGVGDVLPLLSSSHYCNDNNISIITIRTCISINYVTDPDGYEYLRKPYPANPVEGTGDHCLGTAENGALSDLGVLQWVSRLWLFLLGLWAWELPLMELGICICYAPATVAQRISIPGVLSVPWVTLRKQMESSR